jgi:signal transduction histidine kinase
MLVQKRLQRLIENFITLVELDSGDAAKTFSWRQRPITDMEGLARDALRQVEQPEQRPRQFNIHIDPELPNVTADSQFLTIIMRELLDNAAKFSHDNAKIDLDISLDGDYYLIAVTDEGRGIASAYHDDVWLPFFQIDREEFEDQGSGSGLAIIDGLVEIHGGSRNLVSAPQQGCTVTLRLPIDPPHALE